MSYEVQIRRLQEFNGKNAPKEKITGAIEQLKKLVKMRDNLSLEKTLAYAKRIRPVARFEGNVIGICHDMMSSELYWIGYENVSMSSYMFGAKKLVKAEGLKEIARVKTYHTMGTYASFLCPTVDEVIYQCPKDILDRAVAFEVICKSRDVLRCCYDRWLNLHVLETVFYEGEMPDAVKQQEVKW